MSKELQGLFLLIMHFASAKVVKLEANPAWLIIDLDYVGETRRFAIWRHTGNVYNVDKYGAAEDDPILTVTPFDTVLPGE